MFSDHTRAAVAWLGVSSNSDESIDDKEDDEKSIWGHELSCPFRGRGLVSGHDWLRAIALWSLRRSPRRKFRECSSASVNVESASQVSKPAILHASAKCSSPRPARRWLRVSVDILLLACWSMETYHVVWSWIWDWKKPRFQGPHQGGWLAINSKLGFWERLRGHGDCEIILLGKSS